MGLGGWDGVGLGGWGKWTRWVNSYVADSPRLEFLYTKQVQPAGFVEIEQEKGVIYEEVGGWDMWGVFGEKEEAKKEAIRPSLGDVQTCFGVLCFFAFLSRRRLTSRLVLSPVLSCGRVCVVAVVVVVVVVVVLGRAAELRKGLRADTI